MRTRYFDMNNQFVNPQAQTQFAPNAMPQAQMPNQAQQFQQQFAPQQVAPQAGGSVNVGISKSWPLQSFIAMHGAPTFRHDVPSSVEPGTTFDSLEFPMSPSNRDGSRMFVSFSSRMNKKPENMDELKARKHEFSVCLMMSGKYKLTDKSGNFDNVETSDISDWL